MTDNYILDGRIPVPCDDLMAWADWNFSPENNERHRRVAQTTAEGITVSTVFLGTDHNFSGIGPPILFETMVFWPDGPLDEECERYETWDEAEEGHRVMEARVNRLLQERGKARKPPPGSEGTPS